MPPWPIFYAVSADDRRRLGLGNLLADRMQRTVKRLLRGLRRRAGALVEQRLDAGRERGARAAWNRLRCHDAPHSDMRIAACQRHVARFGDAELGAGMLEGRHAGDDRPAEFLGFGLEPRCDVDRVAHCGQVGCTADREVE